MQIHHKADVLGGDRALETLETLQDLSELLAWRVGCLSGKGLQLYVALVGSRCWTIRRTLLSWDRRRRSCDFELPAAGAPREVVAGGGASSSTEAGVGRSLAITAGGSILPSREALGSIKELQLSSLAVLLVEISPAVE